MTYFWITFLVASLALMGLGGWLLLTDEDSTTSTRVGLWLMGAGVIVLFFAFWRYL